MMSANQVADDHARLIATVSEPGRGMDLVAATISSMHGGDFEDPYGRKPRNREARANREATQKVINNATRGMRLVEMCMVSEEMWEMARVGAETADPESLPFERDKLPIEDGILYHPRETLADVHGVALDCDAIAWRRGRFDFTDTGESREGVVLFFFTNEKHKGGGSWDEMVAGPVPDDWPDWTVFATSIFLDGDPITALKPDEPLIQKYAEESTYTEEGMKRTLGEKGLLEMQWWVTMLLMSQTVAAPEPAPLSRATRKRLERLDLQPSVTLIALRKTKPVAGEGEGGGGGTLTMRHVVRHHWRFNHKTGRKDIFVHAYVKGPEDAPLRVTKKVNALIR